MLCEGASLTRLLSWDPRGIKHSLPLSRAQRNCGSQKKNLQQKYVSNKQKIPQGVGKGGKEQITHWICFPCTYHLTSSLPCWEEQLFPRMLTLITKITGPARAQFPAPFLPKGHALINRLQTDT